MDLPVVERSASFPPVRVECPCGGEVRFPLRKRYGECGRCKSKIHRLYYRLERGESMLCPTCGGLVFASASHSRCALHELKPRMVVRAWGRLWTTNRWFLDLLLEHDCLEEYLMGGHPLKEFSKRRT